MTDEPMQCAPTHAVSRLHRATVVTRACGSWQWAACLRFVVFAVLGGVLLGPCGMLRAQSSDVVLEGPSPQRISLGDSALVAIVAKGEVHLSSAPDLPEVDGLGVSVSGPSRMDSTVIQGGRIVREILERWVVELVPTRVGEFEVPAFEVELSDGSSKRLGPVRLSVVENALGSLLAVDVVAAQDRVHVGEPWRVLVEVRVDARIEPSLARAENGELYRQVLVEGDWLDDFPGGVRADVELVGANDNIGCNQRLQPVRRSVASDDGLETVVYRFERTFVPEEPGRYRVPEIAARARLSRRGRFGERRSEVLRSFSDRLEVEVVPLPEAGRPEDFGGAVGRFSVRAEVDEKRLRVGDSLKLSLRIEGIGNFKSFEPPALPDLEGFHQFGRTESVVPGPDGSQALVVTFDLTPLRVDVEPIPPIAFSFFDTRPGVETYRTVASAPIELTILPLEDGAELAPLENRDANEEADVVAGVDDLYDLLPAAEWSSNEPLQVPPRSGFGARWLAVLGPWVLMLSLVVLRAMRQRARLADPGLRRARGARRAFDRALAGGGSGSPVDALAGYLAARLGVDPAGVISPDLADRLVAGGIADRELATRTQRAIDAGIAVRYGGGDRLEASDARELVDALELARSQQGKSSRVAGTVSALVLVALAATSLRAQGGGDAGSGPASPVRESVVQATGSDAAIAGRAAYRAGDYAQAEAAFRRALAGTAPDRRLYYALGNSLYRQQKFAEALLAFERARLAMPRDPNLLANLRLTRRALDVTERGTGDGASFVEGWIALRRRLASWELLALCAIANGLTAAGLLLARGRWQGTLRGVALLSALPAIVLSFEVLVRGPAEPPRAVVLRRAEVRAEPRAELEPVLRLRRGVTVDVLAEGPDWSRIGVPGQRAGWVENRSIGVVR